MNVFYHSLTQLSFQHKIIDMKFNETFIFTLVSKSLIVLMDCHIGLLIHFIVLNISLISLQIFVFIFARILIGFSIENRDLNLVA